MKRDRVFASVVILALLVSGLSASLAVAAPPDRATLPGSAPSWANSKTYTGPADPSSAVGFRVYLGWKDAAGAEALAKAVSDPNSSSYGHFVTPQQFRQRFAPSGKDVAGVQSWLRQQGFDVVYTPENNHFVSAEGTVAQAKAAFAVDFGMYKVRGKVVRAPSSDVSIPNSLAGIVNGVIGLDDSSQFVQTYHIADTSAPPTEGFRNAPPLSEYWAEQVSPYAYPKGFTSLNSPPTVPWSVKGHTPQQIKGAYGISDQYDGKGQTVAIIDAYASPTILDDVNQWSRNRGLPTMSPSQLVQVVPPGIYRRPQNPRQDPQGWYGEETLDVEAVHGMAPCGQDRLRGRAE